MPCANRRSEMLKVDTINGPAYRPLTICAAKSTDRAVELAICSTETNLGLRSMIGPDCTFDANNETQCPYFRAAP